MPFTLDPNLREFATDRQWEIMETADRLNSMRAAGRELNINMNAVRSAVERVKSKAAKRGYSPEHDYTRTVPDGYKLRGVSSYYDKEGELRGQWVKSQVDTERQIELIQAAIKGVSEAVPRAKPVKAPKVGYNNLMTNYIVGDHHLGMLSWHEETGENYDLGIGESLLNGAIDYLSTVAPSTERATLVFLGDFFHYDSWVPETPTSKNNLDADSRFPDMIEIGFRCIRYTIDRALAKHAFVHVVFELGNHDPAMGAVMSIALANIYENEPRLTIDQTPARFHYIRWGNNLVGIHHGDQAKPAELPLIMANDRRTDWGETEHRMWWTGHIHHDSRKDYTGCSVESFRVLPPGDAWHHMKGYRAKREMQSIILHRDYGVFHRNIFNPEMLRDV